MRLGKIMCLAATVAVVSSCATKGYVNEQVAALETRQNAGIQAVGGTAQEALQRATAAGVLAQGKFLYTVVLTDDSTRFDSSRSELSATAQSRLAQLATTLKNDNKNVYLEIQGHSDATGGADYNQRLGLARAEAVKRYLHMQGVALNRMATISYGEDKPAASNDSAAGRASNRRVEVVVLN
jgi:outer membrane protein OmpA-like peptidoglycan-associated protein